MDYKEKIIGILTNNELTSEQKKQLKKIFPELKESEDERIRKEIIDYIKTGTYKKDWIAWLEKQGSSDMVANAYLRGCNDTEKKLSEKQGEQKSDPYNGVSFEYNGHIWGMCARDYGVEIGIDGNLRAFISLDKSFIYPTNPKGKSATEAINEIKVDNANKIEPKDYSSIDPYFFKPTDKVEPRFKIDEWLCENEPNNYARFIQILEIVNVQGKDKYRISRDIHKDEDIVEFDFIEKHYHKFDIQDAKNGDILARDPIYNYSFPFVAIYKNCGFNFFNSYCFIGFKGTFHIDESRHHTTVVHPATKEQRELLFKKMHEEGYEWDADTKELKKIDARENLTLDGDLMQADCMVIEQKPAWSEEDNKIINKILCICNDFKRSFEISPASTKVVQNDIDKIDSWLKSLKDRLK